jgi:NagD protein
MAYSILCDIDGVLYRGEKALPGAARFIAALQRSGRKHLFLTNSPDHSPSDLSRRFRKLFRIEVPKERFYTAAEAIGSFVVSRRPKPRVFVIGSRHLRAELLKRGAVLVDKRAHFVVATGGGSYGMRELDKAVELIQAGAKFLTANNEPASPGSKRKGLGCGALVAPIEQATGVASYAVGKPNHLMIDAIEERMSLDPSRAIMIGDSLNTDVDLGIQARMKTILVLTGVTTREELARSPFSPDYVFPSVAGIHLGRLP